MLASFKLEGEEKYRELLDIREKQRIFFLYMYELWRDKRGENNSTTARYKAAAINPEYEEELYRLLDDSIVVDDRSDAQKEFDEATERLKKIETELADLRKQSAINRPEQAEYAEKYKQKRKEAAEARRAVHVAKRKMSGR